MNGEGEDASKVIHVKFITKLYPPFKVPVSSVVIPSNVTRLGLSSIVNSLLTLGRLLSLSMYLVDCLVLSSKLCLIKSKIWLW